MTFQKLYVSIVLRNYALIYKGSILQNSSVPVFDQTADRSQLSAELEIVYVEQRSGVKAGKPWSMYVAQCLVREEDGRVITGDLVIPQGMDAPKIGRFDAHFKVGVTWEKKVGGVLVALVPI